MDFSKLKMIVCVSENNLIGDANPTGNGLLWHSKEELQFFKANTVGNVVLFGKNTAAVTPIEMMRKTRDVIVFTRDTKIEDILNEYQNTEKDIFICGGYTIYKYFLENYQINTILLSRLKDHVRVEEAKNPLFLPKPEDYGYKVVNTEEHEDFICYTYQK